MSCFDEANLITSGFRYLCYCLFGQESRRRLLMLQCREDFSGYILDSTCRNYYYSARRIEKIGQQGCRVRSLTYAQASSGRAKLNLRV
jgi:hypothetical protein